MTGINSQDLITFIIIKTEQLGDLRYWFNPQDVRRDGVGYQLYGDRKFLFGTHIVPLYCVYKRPSLSSQQKYMLEDQM